MSLWWYYHCKVTFGDLSLHPIQHIVPHTDVTLVVLSLQSYTWGFEFAPYSPHCTTYKYHWWYYQCKVTLGDLSLHLIDHIVPHINITGGIIIAKLHLGNWVCTLFTTLYPIFWGLSGQKTYPVCWSNFRLMLCWCVGVVFKSVPPVSWATALLCLFLSLLFSPFFHEDVCFSFLLRHRWELHFAAFCSYTVTYLYSIT